MPKKHRENLILSSVVHLLRACLHEFFLLYPLNEEISIQFYSYNKTVTV
jgi:hypothetical protein